MIHRDFCYWLQGFFEISHENELNEHQIAIIKEHLQLVFKKETSQNLVLNDVRPFNGSLLNWNTEIHGSC